MTKKSFLSWVGYLNIVRRQFSNGATPALEEFHQLVNFNASFSSVLYHSIPMVYLLDYATGKYLTVSKGVKGIIGYDPEDFMNRGVDFTLKIYHKDDLRIFNEEIFPDRLNFLKRIPAEEHANYVFSYNYRMVKPNGEYVNLLQRNCFVKSDTNRNPLASIGVIINVDHFKKNNPTVQTIEKLPGPAGDGVAATVFKKAYYLHEEDRLFSKREKELLLWMSDGLTSKEIADKLFISEHTVINHRRNMQVKSGTRNVAELMSFALKKEII